MPATIKNAPRVLFVELLRDEETSGTVEGGICGNEELLFDVDSKKQSSVQPKWVLPELMQLAIL
jgi:hypothetical protein